MLHACPDYPALTSSSSLDLPKKSADVPKPRAASFRLLSFPGLTASASTRLPTLHGRSTTIVGPASLSYSQAFSPCCLEANILHGRRCGRLSFSASPCFFSFVPIL